MKLSILVLNYEIYYKKHKCIYNIYMCVYLNKNNLNKILDIQESCTSYKLE